MRKYTRMEYSLMNMCTGMIGYGINTVVGFVCRIIFVRTLSADYLGVGGLFTNILSVLSLAELGISSAIIYALYKPISENDEDKIASIMWFYKRAYTMIGISVFIIGLAFIPFLHLIIVEPPNIKENIYILYLLFLFNTAVSYFYSYRSSLLIAMQRQYIVSGYNYIITILQSVIQIAYLVCTHEYLGYLIIQIVGMFLYNIAVSKKAAKDYPYIKKKNIKPLSRSETIDLLKNIKALAVNKVSGVLVNSTDNIAISFFKGISSVGYVSNYILLSSTLGGVIGQVFNALPGSVGNLNATVGKEKSYRFFKVLNLTNFWLFGWGAIGMLLVSGDLVALLYGSEYVLPIEIPFIIAINSYTIGMLQASYTYKSTLGLFRYGQYILFFTGIINLVFDVILGKKYGMFGIFLATLIARAVTNLWYEPYAVYRYGFHKSVFSYWKRYLYFTFVLVLAGTISFGACMLCDFSIVCNVLIKVVICTIIPNLVFVLCFRRTEEFQYLKSSMFCILNKVKLKLGINKN